MNDWLLEFSVPKCKSMNLGYEKYPFKYSMKDKNGNMTELPIVEEEKDLGITFQKNIKFSRHITLAVNKANRMLGLIRRSFTRLDQQTFITLYKSLVRSILDYGSPVWSSTLKKDLQLVENVQCRATKLVPELRNLPYRERLVNPNLPTLYHWRCRYDLIEIFKIINKFEDISYRKFFEFNDNTTRGHIFKLDKPRCFKSKKLDSFPARSIFSWNSLKEDTVCSTTVMGFKTKLDKEWARKRFDTDIIYKPGKVNDNTSLGGVYKSST